MEREGQDMGTEQGKKAWGTSRQAEEKYLQETLAVVRDNVESYGQEVARMQGDIDEMLAHYHDNDTEVLTILNNTVTLHTHMKRALERNEKAQDKPYFGRIVFHDETLDKEESLYIGRGGISRDTTHWMVVDWRAPVANAYYENSLGKCSYTAPGGVEMKIDLGLKRTYEIEGGKLVDFFDSEVVANDDLLTKYLAKNKQAVLGEIVATIQKEQNEIIRKSPYHNTIVQGVAGSGKTTVAMHRISYILYNYKEQFRPDDFYIVGSNRILLNYITGVLPDLDVYGVRQMTLEQLFIRLLYEDWEENKFRIRSTEKDGGKGSIKGKTEWFLDLEEYCRRLEWEVIPRETVFLNRRQFVEGFRDGKTGVFDKTGGKPARPEDLVRLAEQEAVENYIRQNPLTSVQNKIDMLNERLKNKVEEEFLGKGISYTEAERKAIRKAYRGRYGGRIWKRSIYEMYQEFLTEQAARGYGVDVREGEYDVYDLAALAYLYKRVKEKETIREAHHVVIDEAQDFGMMAYRALHFCIRGCTYTIMGDVSQNIHFGYGLNDWEELKGLLLTDRMDSFGILKKSYRNTVEISKFATNILHHGQFSTYPVEPIIRHGNPVQVRQTTDLRRMFWEAAQVCREWQAKGLDTIAIVCRDREGAAAVSRELAGYVELMESDLEKAEFGNGILVLPVEYTKGLEFDAVLIFNPVREAYPVDDGHAKLLYVAATRALHELCVLHMGNLTGLIADPVPENARDGDRKDVSEKRTALEEKKPFNRKKAETEGRKPRADVRAETDKTERPGTGLDAKKGDRVQTGDRAKPNIRPDAARSESLGNRTETGNAGKAGDSQPSLRIKRPAAKLAAGSKDMAAGRMSPGAKRVTAKIRRDGEGYGFGDLPTTEKLRPAGHAKTDQAIRWCARQEDGLYLQSRYGTLRLSPVDSAIVRVTFSRGGKLAQGAHPQIAIRQASQAWMYKESAKMVELRMDELCLQVEKASGSIRYMTRDRKLLLAERGKESRQLETGTGGRWREWLYLEWPKGEIIYGFGAGNRGGMGLRGTARYISMGKGEAGLLPFLVSEKGYGIALATDGDAFSCDIPVYGSYLYMEGEGQMDYYFIGGEGVKGVLEGYMLLCASER